MVVIQEKLRLVLLQARVTQDVRGLPNQKAIGSRQAGRHSNAKMAWRKCSSFHQCGHLKVLPVARVSKRHLTRIRQPSTGASRWTRSSDPSCVRFWSERWSSWSSCAWFLSAQASFKSKNGMEEELIIPPMWASGVSAGGQCLHVTLDKDWATINGCLQRSVVIQEKLHLVVFQARVTHDVSGHPCQRCAWFLSGRAPFKSKNGKEEELITPPMWASGGSAGDS